MIARLMGLSTVSPANLQQLLRDRAATAIDVNSRQSWLQARVPGALHLDPTAYTESDLPQDKDAMLVFYCSGFLCRKAPNAARRAKTMGYTNVHVMSAGISGWLDANLPTDSGEPRSDK
jgi:rhodanese-related sulfurtransferase